MDPLKKTRPCWVEIDTRALEDNYSLLKELAAPGVECLAIVKADAYGHSLALCAPAAVRAGARWLGVTSVEEGVAARAVCPDARIVVIGGVFPGQAAAVFEHGLTPVVWDAWQLEELESYGRANGRPAGSMPVHLEIDTGMSRQGAGLDQLPELLSRFTDTLTVALDAVMTHLYASDEAHGETTSRQIQELDNALEVVRAVLPAQVAGPVRLSVGASAALLGGAAGELRALGQKHNLVPMLRLGLALYGLAPEFDPAFAQSEEPAELAAARARLRPVLAWKSEVVSVRSVEPGTEVGYNGTFIATEPMRLALVAAGYADGVDRRLGNHFSFLVRGQRVPVVGRVSMDQLVLDVTEVPDCAAHDEVVMIGAQGSETISAFDHARVAGTIPWEIFTRITPRVQRIAV